MICTDAAETCSQESVLINNKINNLLPEHTFLSPTNIPTHKKKTTKIVFLQCYHLSDDTELTFRMHKKPISLLFF